MLEETPITRRAWLTRMASTALGGAAIAVLRSRVGAAEGATPITVYKDPSCGCCTKWVAHLQASGFTPTVHDRADMDALKDSLAIPPALRSCHTAVAGTYLIEGHVPAADIRRLLAAKQRKVAGLAVPGMPTGSPGMEMGGRTDPYEVVAFTAGGTTAVFARH